MANANPTWRKSSFIVFGGEGRWQRVRDSEPLATAIEVDTVCLSATVTSDLQELSPASTNLHWAGRCSHHQSKSMTDLPKGRKKKLRKKTWNEIQFKYIAHGYSIIPYSWEKNKKLWLKKADALNRKPPSQLSDM